MNDTNSVDKDSKTVDEQPKTSDQDEGSSETTNSIPVETDEDKNGSSAQDTDGEDEEPDGEKSEIERLEEKLEEVKMERDELEEKYLRKAADIDNLKKRQKQEKKKLRKYAAQDILEDLLEVIDNFHRALDSMEFESEDVKDGIDMIDRQLGELLSKHNVDSMEAEGDTFDPNLHEAMMQEEREDLDEQIVLEVFQEGYSLHENVLRPAQVKVGVPAEESEAPDEQSENEEDE